MRSQVNKRENEKYKDYFKGHKVHLLIKTHSLYNWDKTQNYHSLLFLLLPPLPSHCRFSNSLHIARGSFSYLPLRGRRKRDFLNRWKYGFKFREKCTGESGTEKRVVSGSFTVVSLSDCILWRKSIIALQTCNNCKITQTIYRSNTAVIAFLDSSLVFKGKGQAALYPSGCQQEFQCTNITGYEMQDPIEFVVCNITSAAKALPEK